jgi:type IV pilus assembly protein PilA
MLLQNLRARIGARLSGNRESGFTLIELLVVMLILGILAAIALPAFFNQKDKAGDAKAKEYAHSAQVAMETWATDHGGLYTGADADKLEDIEPTLSSATFTAVTPSTDGTGYTITVQGAKSTQTFSVENDGGEMSFPCTVGGEGGCPVGATEGGPGDWGG